MLIFLFILFQFLFSSNCELNYGQGKFLCDGIHYPIVHKNMFYEIKHKATDTYFECPSLTLLGDRHIYVLIPNKNKRIDYYRFTESDDFYCRKNLPSSPENVLLLKTSCQMTNVSSHVFMIIDDFEVYRASEYFLKRDEFRYPGGEKSDWFPRSAFWDIISKVPRGFRYKPYGETDDISLFELKLHPDYKLKYNIQFMEKMSLKDIINEHKKVDFLTLGTIKNNQSSISIKSVDYTRTNVNEITITTIDSVLNSSSFTEEDIWSLMSSTEITATREGGIGIPGLFSFKAALESKFQLDLSKGGKLSKTSGSGDSSTTTSTKTVRKEMQYKIHQKVECAPFKNLNILAKTILLKDLLIEFNLVLTVEGTGPQFVDEGKLNSTYLGLLVIDSGLYMEPTVIEDYKLTFNIPFNIKVNLGIKTYFEVQEF